MNSIAQFEHRASSSRSTHEGESSTGLCDRLSRTRDFSQRQLPTDHDYAVSTREYQTDQSSLKSAPAAAGPVLERRQKQRQQQKQPHRCAAVDRVTPYQSSFAMGVDRSDRPFRGFPQEKPHFATLACTEEKGKCSKIVIRTSPSRQAGRFSNFREHRNPCTVAVARRWFRHPNKQGSIAMIRFANQGS